MRISDWSSDVCSSDLGIDRPLVQRPGVLDVERLALRRHRVRRRPGLPDAVVVHLPGRVARGAVELVGAEFVIGDGAIAVAVEQAHVVRAVRTVVRSEEHTSELQSLMRISYAVFCLKKKKTKTQV